MTFQIHGFGAEPIKKQEPSAILEPEARTLVPRKSLVQVRFPDRGMTLSYYNDKFDLKPGDFVYVDGKLEGQLGRVVDVNYCFKIKLSDYQRVIALVDTHVSGQFFFAGSHFVTFDPHTLPRKQASLWFKAPPMEDDEFASGTDDSGFHLEDLESMKVTAAIAQRGRGYYMENKVRYLCLDGAQGYAIVEGTSGYEVEFEYRDGEISNLVCDCPCGYPCKHQVAAMLQLRETLSFIEEHYMDAFRQTGYFAAVHKATLFVYAIDGKQTGSLTL